MYLHEQIHHCIDKLITDQLTLRIALDIKMSRDIKYLTV